MANPKIEKALEFACRYGGIDGDHHKMWVIDQMVRALTGCPMETRTAFGPGGVPYTYEAQGKSDEYRAWIAESCAGDGGPETYSWDEGVSP